MHHYFLTLINGVAPLCTIQRLKLPYDKLISNFAFKFNLSRYNLQVDPIKPTSKAPRSNRLKLK